MAEWKLPGPDEQLLGIRQVEEFTGHGRRAIRRLIADGRFPRPRLRAKNTDLWHAADLAAWMHLADRLRVGEVPEEIGDDEDG